MMAISMGFDGTIKSREFDATRLRKISPFGRNDRGDGVPVLISTVPYENGRNYIGFGM